MPNNINKVIFGDNTLMDLTSDTVEASNLLEGETAHDRSGTPITGTAKQGHVIKDQDGTSMTQRGNLKFEGGFNVGDDSQNNTTKVQKDIPITWDEWNQLTEQEAEGKDYFITNEPYVSGKINTEVFTKLWENPNPDVDFATQTIELSNDDWDMVHLIYKFAKSSAAKKSLTTDANGIMEIAYTTGSVPLNVFRTMEYVDKTHFLFSNSANVRHDGNSQVVQNNYLIPYQIYGFKKNIEFDLTALVANVSTDASKCMVDKNTSVVDKLAESYVLTIPTSGYSTVSKNIWNTGAKNYQAITISVDVNNNPLTNFHSGMKEDYPINIDGSQSDFGKLYAFEIGEGQVTFYFTSAPSSAFNVLIREAV